jgi:hypothetical protein
MPGKLCCPGLLIVAGWMLVLGFARVHGQGSAVAEGKPAPKVELPAVNVATALPDQKDAKTLSLDAFSWQEKTSCFSSSPKR